MSSRIITISMIRMTVLHNTRRLFDATFWNTGVCSQGVLSTFGRYFT